MIRSFSRGQRTSAERRETHSRFKVVVNSATGLALLLQRLINKNSHKWLAFRFSAVVRRLIEIEEFQATGHSMYMFDSVNYIMSLVPNESENTGYRPVIRILYEELQSTLKESSNYWLQRAKSVLHLEDQEGAILEGLEFATKCYLEAPRARTVDNAEFTIALLYGKLCWVTNYENVDYVCQAIKWFSQAIQNYANNHDYVKSMLEGRYYRGGWFHKLCDFLETGFQTDVKMLAYKRDADYLKSMRRAWKLR